MDGAYFPPFDLLQRGLVQSEDKQTVTLSADLFKMLVAAAHASSFDPVLYLSHHPDVSEALGEGRIDDEFQHFQDSGYIEGRLATTFDVDEVWYRETYPDIAEALNAGDVPDARTHFHEIGYFEGRAPNAEAEEVVRRWIETIHESAEVVSARQS